MGMFKKSAKSSKTKKSKSSIGSKLKGAVSKLSGRSASTGKRRRKGPEYWARKLLTERLKKRYWKVKYGGR